MKVTLSSPLKYKNSELTELDMDLESLTGRDLIMIEDSLRAQGNTSQMFSQNYFAAIASRALHLPLDVIKGLPVKDFMKLTNQVILFLTDTVSEITPQVSSEE